MTVPPVGLHMHDFQEQMIPIIESNQHNTLESTTT